MLLDFTSRLGRRLSLIVLCLLAACDGQPKKSAPANAAVGGAAQTQRVGADQKPPSYERELEALNEAIEGGIRLSAKQPNDVLLPLEIVSVYLERARLTGNYDDYRKAESLLASEGSRPSKPGNACLAQARLHYTLHRLKLASAALDACPSSASGTEIAAIRADIAFYSGRYKEAETVYRVLVNQVGLTGHYVRLALLKNKMGSPGEAAAFLEAAEKRYHGGSATMKAWLKLQRGLVALDSGRLDEALALYGLADEALPGWWLVEEHIAEVASLSGNTQKAKAIYEDVIRKTGAPEYMDALAVIEFGKGNKDGAQKAFMHARSLYEDRLARFPEAAAGHALDHFLRDAGNPQRALSLAQMNFGSRPYGDAAIALAKAWVLNKKPMAAIPLLEAEISRGWDTADLYWTLAEAWHNAEDAQRAAQARSEALRRNPRSADMYTLTALKL